MVYKRFIYKNGKKYGPYIYHNKRINGQVVSNYLGKSEKQKKFLHYTFFSILIIIFLSLIIYYQSFYGNVIFEKEDKPVEEGIVVDISKQETKEPLFEAPPSNEIIEDIGEIIEKLSIEESEEQLVEEFEIDIISEKTEQVIEEEIIEKNVSVVSEENITAISEEEIFEKEFMFEAQAMPENLTVFINSSWGTNTSIENITCWANASDPDSTYLNYSGFWYKNGEQQFNTWNAFDTGGGYMFGSWDVAVDSNGNIISVGTKSSFNMDILVLKYSPTGTKLWERSFSGSSFEQGYDVAVDNESNIYAVGYTRTYSPTNTDDFLVIKYNPSGTQLWNFTFDSGGSESARGIALFSNGDLVVAGRPHIMRLNSSGSLLWNISAYYIEDVVVDPEDNIITTGSGGTKKYNSSGSEKWFVSFFQTAQGITLDSENNIIVTGNDPSYNMRTIKYNSSGSQLWNESFNGNNWDLSYNVAVDSQDNIYVVGATRSFGAGSDDFFVVKYNSSGYQIWNKTVGGTGSDFGLGITTDAQDNVVISGSYGGASYVQKFYGFSSINQNPGVFSIASFLNENLLLPEELWSCEVKVFDGQNYTSYTTTNIIILNVPLYCGINITEQVTANESLYCNGTAINIVKNNVVFDCGGFDIVGNRTPGTYGIKIQTYNNTYVKNCNILNFYSGIHILNSSKNNITNNVFQNNIELSVLIENSKNTTIFSNSFYDSEFGVLARKSIFGYYYNNFFSDNLNAGLSLFNCSTETIDSNDFVNNSLYGILLSNVTYTGVENNEISSNYIALMLNFSFGNTFSSNNINNNNNTGVYFYKSNNNDFSNSLIKQQNINIVLNGSNSNTIKSNTITDSFEYGFLITSDSQSNLFYNNFLNNTINAFDSGDNNWNTTINFQENIIAGSYIGGNYWSDYLGNDTDRDGFGDELLPWNSSGNISIGGDWLPLTEEYRPIIIRSLILNSTDLGNTPAENITCWANTTNDNDNNLSYHGFWYKNDEQLFENIFSINSSDLILSDSEDVTIDNQNNIIVAGQGYKIVKLNSSLYPLWNVINSLGTYAHGIEADSEDNIIIAGYSSGYDIITMKYNSSGINLWNATYDLGGIDQAYDLALDSQDNIYVSGQTYINSAYRALLLKYSSSGSHLWNITVSGIFISQAVATDDQDNVIFAAHSYGSGSHFLAKYNSSGSLIWQKYFSPTTSPDYPLGITTDSFNNIIITGMANTPVATALFVEKIDKYGNLIWSKSFDEQQYDYGNDVITDRQNNILVAGQTNSFGAGEYSAILLKYDKNGNLLWYRLYTQSPEWNGVALDVKGDIIVTGSLNLAKYSGFKLENQNPWEIVKISEIDNSQIDDGDTWKCEVIAFDEHNYSKYKISNSLRLLYPTTAGGRGACISSWSCGSPGSCVDGSAEVICTDTKNCLTSTNLPSGCVKSGQGECTRTVSCEEELLEEENMTIMEEEEVSCNEDWDCTYGNCQVDGYRYPLSCVDLNDCGTTSGQPGPILCECTPVLECGDWQECRVDYGFEELVEGEYIDLNGTQIRECTDTSGCIGYPVEELQDCTVTVPVSLIEEAWGNETYVFVQDESTGQTVARVKIGSLYLTFIPTSSVGYYDYCFNEIQDYDETGIDCGGSCSSCTTEYYDNFFMIKYSVMAASILAIFFIFFLLIRDFFNSFTGNLKTEVTRNVKTVTYRTDPNEGKTVIYRKSKYF